MKKRLCFVVIAICGSFLWACSTPTPPVSPIPSPDMVHILPVVEEPIPYQYSMSAQSDFNSTCDFYSRLECELRIGETVLASQTITTNIYTPLVPGEGLLGEVVVQWPVDVFGDHASADEFCRPDWVARPGCVAWCNVSGGESYSCQTVLGTCEEQGEDGYCYGGTVYPLSLSIYVPSIMKDYD